MVASVLRQLNIRKTAKITCCYIDRLPFPPTWNGHYLISLE
ncbi:hypothetical protein PROVRUST_06215 [Providencia rustigianii DSM 4541]|uniref:Uncharacterized protein n=1 Tax=Providencia rustigianii DSM 4541 TaxID=500637 RepID=D1P1Z2_9GAMM|nr:hypothetical protein PROVRUST_06215 [Providencia rustigianii DSM 4541]